MTTKYEAPKLPDGYYFNVRQNRSCSATIAVEILKTRWWDFILDGTPIVDEHVDTTWTDDVPKLVYDTMTKLATLLPIRLRGIEERTVKKSIKESVMGKYPPKKVIG